MKKVIHKNISKKIPQQSDILITADGKISISFLWKDLEDLFNPTQKHILSDLPLWNPPQNISFNSKIETEYSNCILCPKECGYNRNQNSHPNCGDAYLRVSNAGLTLGDEPMVRGHNGSGAIMFSGCPLTCPSCHNPEKVAHGEITSPDDFLLLCKKLLDDGAHNLQLLSPTVHLPKLKSLLTVLKDSSYPIPIILKSSGYESIAELKKLEGLVDVYLPDFKFGPCSEWGKRAGVKDYFEKAKDTIDEMFRQVGKVVQSEDGLIKKGVLIRHVQAPLPYNEKNSIEYFLSSLPEGICLSYPDNFVMLE